MNNRPRAARVIALFAGGSALLLGVAGCFGSNTSADESDQDENPQEGDAAIRLALNNTSSSLTAVVAEEQGFFDDHGLDVTSDVMVDITKIPPALGNQYDIGFGVAPIVIRSASQGLDVVVVSGNGTSSADHAHMVVVAAADSGIESAEDLEGRTLGAPTLTGTLHLGTLQWLSDAGIDQESVNSVQVATPTMIDQIKQGVIDAAELQEPHLSLARDEGLVEVGYSLAAVADVVQESVWIANGDWASENEEPVLAFRAAIADAAEWIVENDSEAKELLADFTETDISLLENASIMLFDSDVRVADIEAWGRVMGNVTDFTADVDYSNLIAYPND